MQKSDCEKLPFIYNKDGKALEGYLGAEGQAEILFVLKEPHGEKLNCFWMKDNVVNNRDPKKHEKRYLTVLGSLACHLLGRQDRKEALEQCAYINLFPFKGENVASDLYKQYLAGFGDAAEEACDISDLLEKSESDQSYSKDDLKRIAKNRKYIIKHLNCKYIVTVGEIFGRIAVKPYNEGFKYGDTGKKFRTGGLNGNEDSEVQVYEFWHPAYWQIKYDNMPGYRGSKPET